MGRHRDIQTGVSVLAVYTGDVAAEKLDTASVARARTRLAVVPGTGQRVAVVAVRTALTVQPGSVVLANTPPYSTSHTGTDTIPYHTMDYYYYYILRES